MGTISKIAPKIAQTPLWVGKKFSKVPFVGTLNLCLETPDTMQKTKSWSDHHVMRKCPKTAEIIQSFFTKFLTVLERFLSPGRSDLCLVFCIVSGISRHKFRVPTKGTLEEFFFSTCKGVRANLVAHCGRWRWLTKKLKIGTWLYKYIFNNIFFGQNYLTTFWKNGTP